jgi:hypothetical protein
MQLSSINVFYLTKDIFSKKAPKIRKGNSGQSFGRPRNKHPTRLSYRVICVTLKILKSEKK